MIMHLFVIKLSELCTFVLQKKKIFFSDFFFSERTSKHWRTRRQEPFVRLNCGVSRLLTSMYYLPYPTKQNEILTYEIFINLEKKCDKIYNFILNDYKIDDAIKLINQDFATEYWIKPSKFDNYLYPGIINWAASSMFFVRKFLILKID